MIKQILAAAITNPAIQKSEGDFNTVAVNPLGGLLARLWWTVVIVGGLALLIFLIWGGIDYLNSQGEAEKIKNAQSKITHALMGMAILAASFAIMKITEGIFGFNLLKPAWPTP